MHVIDLEGKEYIIQATSINENEVNGNQSFSATILPTKANKLFIDDIQEMWHVVDHDDVEHKIIYCQRKGEGNSLTVEIKAIPLFFDAMDNERIYERYDEHMTAQLAYTRIFDDTVYGFVLNDSFSAVEWEGFGDGDTRLETFKRALERYKAEFRIVGNTIYLEKRIGNDLNVQYRHRLNADNIVQEIDANEFWTYAKGYGDYGDGEGGEDWQNAKLTSEYTSPLADILGIRHAPPIKNGNITTKSQMDSQLKTLVNDSLKISISADIYDLQKQGYPIGQAQVGDRVFIIDERIGLNEEVRVVDQSKTRNWKGEVIDLNVTFGSEGLSKRHQANLNTATKNITSLLEGKIQLPYSVLDDAVKNATKALHDAQTQLQFTDNGILAIDKNNPNLVTLFNSAGIGVSEDGGATFGQALTGLGLNVDYVYTGSMLADRIAGGILAALNGNTVFNLNDGNLTMESAMFQLGSGATIDFTSRSNAIRYIENNRYAGVGFDDGVTGNPIVFVGSSYDRLTTNDPSWSGLIVFPQADQTDSASSMTSRHFLFRDRLDYQRGIRIELSGSTPTLRPVNAGAYGYNLGETDNRWNQLYLSNQPNVSSDESIKKNIENISLDFAKRFLDADPKKYIKDKNDRFEFGFMAQDVEKSFDDKEKDNQSLVLTDKYNYKSMQYGQIHAIHHVLLQDAFKRIEVLEEKINGQAI